MSLLTPPVISKIPRGLLSFFGLKSGGVNPQSISTVIAPTLELRDWFFETNSEFFQTAAASVFALGNGAFVGPVSDTSNNFMVRYSLQATVPAGSQWSGYPAFRVRIGAVLQAIQVGPTVRHSGGAAAEIVSLVADSPFWIPPGAELGWVTTAIAGPGPVTAIALLQFVPIGS